MDNPKLLKVSNPVIVKKNAIKYLGKDVQIMASNTKDKKYAVITPDGRTINFGDINYSDFTKTGDKILRDLYLKRFLVFVI